MTTPELKAFDCIDHDPIEQWIPASEGEVNYQLCLHIGLPGDEACDLFYMQVTTPEAISTHHPGKSLGKRRIIVNPYSWESVLEAIQATLERCAGDDWSQQSALLAEHFAWEFENYRP